MNHESFGAAISALMGEQQERKGGASMTRPARLLCFAGRSVAAGRSFALWVVGVSALVLAISCADSRGVTGPPAKSMETSLVGAHQAPVNGDVVFMHRSTQVAAHDDVAKVSRTFTEKLGSQLRSVGKEDSPITALTQPDFATGVLPRPVVSLPARAETGMCAVLPSWSRAEHAPDGRKVTVSGRGDAPASVVKVATDDGTVLTIERTWVRTARTWQLARQITTTSDKRYRDEVVYEHQTASGERIDQALPTLACAGNRGPVLASAAASRGFYVPHTSSVASRLFPLSGGRADYSCGDAGGDCFTQQNAVYTADVALVATATVAAYACTAVAVIVPAACVAAGVAWAAAVANLALAQRALNYCLYMLALPKAVALPAPGWLPTANPLALGGMTSSASQLPGPQPELSADCSSGGGSSGGTIQCHSQSWEISYDGGATWSYLTTITVCENIM